MTNRTTTLRTDRNLQLLFASLFLWMVGLALYEGLLPIFARQLGASPVELGTLFTLRNLTEAGGFLLGWAMADRLSRRTVMLVSWVLGAPVPLMLAAAPSYLWLLPGLLLYEITYFGLPAIQAYVTQRVPPSELASTFSVMGTITSTGFLISPAIGGLIADQWGIRTCLVVAFALYALSTVLFLRIEPAGPGTYPVAAEGTLSWRDARSFAPALLVAAMLAVMILTPVPYIPPFLREARGLSLSEIGFLGSMMALGAVLLSPVAGRLGDRIGVVPAIVLLLLTFALGMGLTTYGPAVLLPLAAMLRCRSPVNALGQALVGARVPPAMVGRAFAVVGMLSAGLSALGIFIGGYAYRLDASYPLLLSMGVALSLAVALVWLRPSASPAAGSPG